jgi:hypothetical protein
VSLLVDGFWNHQIWIAENVDEDFKQLALPLARIKKVMKSDPDVKVRCEQCTCLHCIYISAFFVLAR